MRLTAFTFLALSCLAAAVPAHAATIYGAKSETSSEFDPAARPPSMYELQGIEPETRAAEGEEVMPLDIRADALREAGFSYGARGGLASRTYEIRQELDGRASYLDKIFDFRQLLIPAESGLLIEPPIISESLDALNIEKEGLSAAVSDKVYNIGRNARIVSAARTWRAYLEREWDAVDPPPDILRPINREEREKWNDYVSRGWAEGVAQADEIFQEDLNKLTADYRGMVRYRMLLAQGMVSPPYALQIDRGVTGGGNEMRVGDRALSITGLPSLKSDTNEWQPANR